jgi:excisionase family DNA binding protein
MNKTNIVPKQAKSKGGVEVVPLLVSLKEAGRLLGVSPRTVRRLSQKGKLPALVKIGKCCRITRKAVVDYFEKISGGKMGGISL